MGQLSLEADSKYLRVSELVSLLSSSLERSFPNLAFEGEISQVSRPQSGHLYLSIKDETSQIAAVIWRGPASRLGFAVEPGMHVLCEGRPNIFPAAGKLQIAISRIIPAGEGALQAKFLALKEKLTLEGYFAAERKRDIPFLPKGIGVVTSPTGAVIRDIMVKLHERMPQIPVYLAPTRVQGVGAAKEVAAAIQLLNEYGKIDLIIVARGGGSLEDLWAFNEEVVVKAIFASRIPVICGVGHEVDISLADLAADRRAPTPTAAAEMAVPHRVELLKRVEELRMRAGRYEGWLGNLTQRLDEMVIRLTGAAGTRVGQAALRLSAIEAKLSGLDPQKALISIGEKVKILEFRLYNRGVRDCERTRGELARITDALRRARGELFRFLDSRLTVLEERNRAASPINVMSRGYSIVLKEGEVVKDAAQLRQGDSLTIKLARGSSDVSVDKIYSNGEG